MGKPYTMVFGRMTALSCRVVHGLQILNLFIYIIKTHVVRMAKKKYISNYSFLTLSSTAADIFLLLEGCMYDK